MSNCQFIDNMLCSGVKHLQFYKYRKWYYCLCCWCVVLRTARFCRKVNVRCQKVRGPSHLDYIMFMQRLRAHSQSSKRIGIWIKCVNWLVGISSFLLRSGGDQLKKSPCIKDLNCCILKESKQRLIWLLHSLQKFPINGIMDLLLF